jgi:RNA polymerase sigma factor (sigma-70 family)
LAAEGLSDSQLLQRFVAHRDQTAFEALVQRHGPMVLGVCRRQLLDAHAADDAFQATFLVLVRKAATIDRPELLGNWLYGVAFRVAVKARANAARRSAHERQAATMPKTEPAPDTDTRELREILDDELSRLPEKYRAPLVLCYLEGKTNEEAAQLIGCPLGSMSWRLARGRDLLRRRLSGRSLAFPAVLVVPLVGQTAASAAVPITLLNATMKTAMIGAGEAAGAIPASVAVLADEVLQAMGGAKLKALGVALLALIFLLTAGSSAMLVYSWWNDHAPGAAQPCRDPGAAAVR